MRIVTVHQAKINLSGLLKKAADGEEIVITRGDKPIAKLVAIGEVKGRRVPGLLKGELHVGPEFFEPLPKDELEAWNGEACPSIEENLI